MLKRKHETAWSLNVMRNVRQWSDLFLTFTDSWLSTSGRLHIIYLIMLYLLVMKNMFSLMT